MGRSAFCLIATCLCGLLAPDRAAGQVPRRAASVEELSARLAAESRAQRARVDSLVAATGIERRVVLALGDTAETIYELVDVEGGRPLFLGTHNAAAVRSVRAHRLASGGGLGLDLRGDGLMLGIWDGGVAHGGHRELDGRVERMDASGSVANHATHVTGTMAATGIAPEAKGVAPAARVRSWDWSDDANEMAQAASTGLYASNHSYGSLGGWAWNVRNSGRWAWMGFPEERTDWKFGAYDGRAASYDAVAASVPEYVIVRSAGNERADRGPAPGTPHDYYFGGWQVSNMARQPDGGDSGYDTLLDAGNAKNVLVVGAVEDVLVDDPTPSDIRLLALSSMGPTNDGRIKPDLVASGHEVWSSIASGPSAYAWSSGTSMAAPAVTAVAGLLQRLFEQAFGRRPSSALVRGLLIHTADEAGPQPGPDYAYGWGLVNAGRAAAHLLAHRPESPRWLEASVAPDSVFETSVDVGADGVLRVTLAWTDPAGMVQTGPAAGISSPVLVHDLDLEIRIDGPTPWKPWILDPGHPSAAATTGRNSRDNVEQVYREGVTPGRYAVRVRHHRGSGSQAFALVLGETPDASFLAPSISGRVELEGVGLRGIEVSLRGPSIARTVTGPDGRYLFDSVAPGNYVVSADGSFYAFGEATKTLGVVTGNHVADFRARPLARLVGRTFFPSDRLLGPDGWDTSVQATTLTAGGMYGARLDLDGSIDLSGGRVEPDLAHDPQLAAWAGEIGQHYLDLARSWRISPGGPARFQQWIPAIWSSYRAPEGYEARVPLRIFDAGSRLVGVDTLRWTVGTADAVPPVPFAVIPAWGRGFVPVGTTAILEVHLLDGSPITRAQLVVRDRADPTREIQRLALYDDGAYRLHFDETAGDRRFAAAFTPRIEADFRFDLEAEDERGNRVDRVGMRYLSSVPFHPTRDRLLVSWSETESRTSAHAALLDSVDAGADAWEFDVRGAVTSEALSSYRSVVWARDDRGFDQAEERDALARAVNSGTPLLVTGAGAASPGSADWSVSSLHMVPLGPLSSPYGSDDPAGLVEGDPSVPGWSGLRFRLRNGTRLGHVEPAPGAEPLLRVGTRVVAWRHAGVPGRIVGLTFSLLDLASSADAGRLARMLLAEVENDASQAPVPGITALTTPLDGDLGLPAGPVDLAWREQPFSTYEIEVSESEAFDSPVVREQWPSPPFPFDLAQPGLAYRWRVRALSPAGEGPWSEVRMFGVPLPNRPPVIVRTPEPVVLRERGHPALLDPNEWFRDPDDHPLRFSTVVSDPTVVVAAWAEGLLSLRPHSPGRAVVAVQADEPQGASTSLLLDVTVDANRLPTLEVDTESAFVVMSGPSLDVSYRTGDPDGDPVEVRGSAVPEDLATVETREDRVTVRAARPGTGVLRLVATDSLGGDTTRDVPLTVRSNLAPAFSVPQAGLKVFLGHPAGIPRRDLLSDPDGDPVHLSVSVRTEGVADISVTDTSLVLVPLQLGRADVRLEAVDAFGLSSGVDVAVFVGPDPDDDKPLPGAWALAAVFPVPASQVLHVRLDVPEEGPVSLDLFDALGRRRLGQRESTVAAGSPRFSLPVADLASGVYHLRVTTPGGVFLRTVVIAR